jgi:hypothetical protein
MDLAAQWRACVTLHAFEQLTALGWRVSTSTFRRIMGALTLLGLVSLAGFSVLVCDLIRGALLTHGAVNGLPVRLVLLYAAGNVYVLCLGAWREVLTQRRDIIAHPANVEFYRGIDLNAGVAFVVWAAGPILRETAVVCVVAAGFVATFRPELASVVDPPVALLAFPASVGALRVALAGWMATATPAVPRSRPVALFAMVVGIFAAGRTLSLVVPGSASQEGRTPSLAWLDPSVAGLAVELVAAVALCAAVAWFAVHLLRLCAGSFPVRSPCERGWWRRASRLVAGPRSWFTVALLSSMARGRAGRTRRRLHCGLLIAIAATAGVGPLIRLGQAPAGGIANTLLPLSLALTFICALSLLETVVGTAGPSALARHLRVVWELGASSHWVSLAVVSCAVVDGAAVGFAVALARSSLISSFDPGPVIVGAAVGASVVLADVLAPPRLCADESTTPSISSATLGVVLAIPVLAMLLPAERMHDVAPWRVLGAMALFAIMAAGGVACVARRLISMPSSSTT